ncbi:hypothetical protein K402DRAFT_462863 [Aulographum hederae CBS 113979]|uniref:C3H1-type domain-containing protein n=1 Tax=Aulographum hederae CBS 113979 TaxID=1176131 RepID=A0A6G1H3E4_9PEZI|nr:hypothetical protein K402DRAFT_462863 [Aulographum hederae CBS 113979]
MSCTTVNQPANNATRHSASQVHMHPVGQATPHSASHLAANSAGHSAQGQDFNLPIYPPHPHRGHPSPSPLSSPSITPIGMSPNLVYPPVHQIPQIVLPEQVLRSQPVPGSHVGYSNPPYVNIGGIASPYGPYGPTVERIPNHLARRTSNPFLGNVSGSMLSRPSSPYLAIPSGPLPMGSPRISPISNAHSAARQQRALQRIPLETVQQVVGLTGPYVKPSTIAALQATAARGRNLVSQGTFNYIEAHPTIACLKVQDQWQWVELHCRYCNNNAVMSPDGTLKWMTGPVGIMEHFETHKLCNARLQEDKSNLTLTMDATLPFQFGTMRLIDIGFVQDYFCGGKDVFQSIKMVCTDIGKKRRSESVVGDVPQATEKRQRGRNGTILRFRAEDGQEDVSHQASNTTEHAPGSPAETDLQDPDIAQTLGDDQAGHELVDKNDRKKKAKGAQKAQISGGGSSHHDATGKKETESEREAEDPRRKKRATESQIDEYNLYHAFRLTEKSDPGPAPKPKVSLAKPSDAQQQEVDQNGIQAFSRYCPCALSGHPCRDSTCRKVKICHLKVHGEACDRESYHGWPASSCVYFILSDKCLAEGHCMKGHDYKEIRKELMLQHEHDTHSGQE